MGVQFDNVAIPHLSIVLEKWLISKKLHHSCGPSGSLSKILETPAMPMESTSLKTPKEASLQTHSGKSSGEFRTMSEEGCEDIEVAFGKLSLISRPASLDGHHGDHFLALLRYCGQSAPSALLDVFSKYCDPKSIVKVGEGTYGEAFLAGRTVCKIVPFGGDLRVNGEVQKRSEELLEEVVLSRTLNRLRGREDHVYNACTTFIETIDLMVCQGPYNDALTRAWEDWDAKHGSENDHPKEFPEKQCYVVFVQEHGGQDLESFVLLNFDEARSLLVQVTVALAVAEAAYEFEHRDLHWGNILLSRKDSAILQFTLEGSEIFVRTFGLFISIIDFTLSRINTGEDILFLDLSLDPELFDGPKGDKQSETYRKMKEVTEECWEGSFPRTNVLWLQYLVDILLLKKSYDRTSKDERDLRSLKKRLNNYGSAKEATSDLFFKDLFGTHAI
uniref:non-specific serine/threonine protein kinase n=1 Tax=Davidia involucrata TaxID=16924 RepID=A0A5B6ZRV7_DAVIN